MLLSFGNCFYRTFFAGSQLVWIIKVGLLLQMSQVHQKGVVSLLSEVYSAQVAPAFYVQRTYATCCRHDRTAEQSKHDHPKVLLQSAITTNRHIFHTGVQMSKKRVLYLDCDHLVLINLVHLFWCIYSGKILAGGRLFTNFSSLSGC